MKVLSRIVPAAAAAVAVAGFVAPAASASAATRHEAPKAPAFQHQHQHQHQADGALFAMTDSTAGNAVVAYHRAADGKLTQAGTYSTGGLGGVLTGSMVDHTASQGALAYDRSRGLLFAVNPGSDTIAVFKVHGDRLALSQVISSGGVFPVSVTVHGDSAFVLDAFGGGAINGYRIDGDQLRPLPGSFRALGLGTTATSAFTSTPGQVAFTPDGRDLLVTTKGSTNAVDVYAVRADGSLSAKPTVNSLPADVPFAVAFDRAGHVVLAEAGPNAVATFSLSHSGVLTQLNVAATGQQATCWVVRAGRYFYVSNAGSGNVSTYTVARDGKLTSLGTTPTDAGTVDPVSADHGKFLYVRTGAAGNIDEFAVSADGSLTSLGSVTVPDGVAGEGIAVS